MLSEDQRNWIELSRTYDKEVQNQDFDKVVAQEPEDTREATDEEVESLESGQDGDETGQSEQNDDEEEEEFKPKHCLDLYRSLKPSLDILDARTNNAIHDIVVQRLQNN